mmetsp:Transcript_6439/g.6040  ORF Transcript_6439/g.6040 Transcript_6439/m.6040 type:complete len:136 (-) Transcript_6439:282-689(-)
MSKCNVYEHPLHSKLESISTTITTLVTEQYWAHYAADITNQINELEGDSGTDAEIAELERELPKPWCMAYSKANIDIQEGNITNFITILIHHNILWDLGFHLNYRENHHENNNYKSSRSYTTLCYCPCSNTTKEW